MIKEIFSLKDRLSFKSGKGFNDDVCLRGHVVAVLMGPDRKIKTVREVRNTVKNAGIYGAADQILASPTLAKPGWMELGTSSPAATLLGAYIAASRNALTSKTRADAVVTMVCDWAAGDGTGAITEAGVFDVVTENTVNMWLSASFAAINKAAADTLQITWTLTYS